MPRLSPRFSLREIPAPELPSLLPLVHEANPQIALDTLQSRLSAMLPHGYRAVGAFENQALIGVCGFWIFPRFWCGKQMDLDNFVVREAYRNAGIGTALLAWLEALAVHEGCETIVLDTYVSSHDAHKFYYRHGYFAKGYHFIKPLVSGPMTGEAVACISITN
jgi:GNAT superfamily N-acetyltransferase